MKLKPQTVLISLTALAVILVAVMVGLAIGPSDDDPSDTALPAPTTVDGTPSTVTTEAPTTSSSEPERSTTTGPPPPPEAGDDRFNAIPTNLTKLDRTDPEAVAGGWCAYWTRTRSETPQAWAQRLSPITTPALNAALADLNFPGEDPYTRESATGALEPLSGDRWIVNCSTRMLRADGAPIAAPEPTRNTVSLVKAGDGKWVVGAVEVGGLVLPQGSGQ